MKKTVRTVMIGCGGMARYHIRQMLKQADSTEITVIASTIDVPVGTLADGAPPRMVPNPVRRQGVLRFALGGACAPALPCVPL